MAGALQHHIPQFLTRGFRVPGGSKKQSQVWLYAKDEEPRLALIKDEVAVEPHFYSEQSSDGSRTLDDEITDYENKAARSIQGLRNLTPDTPCDPQISAELVAHLTIRNDHLRRTFTLGVQAILGHAIEMFCNEETLRAILGYDGNTPSPALKNAIDAEFASNPQLAALGLPSQMLYQLGHMAVKQNFKTIFADHIPQLAAALASLSSEASERARLAHNKALAAGLAPDKRIEFLSTLFWRIAPSRDSGCLLPDCIALAEDDDQGPKPLMLADLEKLRTVYMPLSPDKLLVGLRVPEQPPNPFDFNAAAAAASQSFFISASREHRFAALSKLTGSCVKDFVDRTIRQIFDEFLAERRATDRGPAIR
ncbi:DUF4238 domain-containing protein [Bradyrhizobium sp. BR13661]|uniref:DUF4238 domain-containing protein n=1 Tax=Bradyrhizobium sp. BR13661 TaxID=2940622 RepID=UPI0024764BC6|nr:DUF4238 domain-containing protein [Bradyrhizobium sp. BR13661]MDH6258419.1 hypothetical protein [Bradyrhizobium sp. BR13661]